MCGQATVVSAQRLAAGSCAVLCLSAASGGSAVWRIQIFMAGSCSGRLVGEVTSILGLERRIELGDWLLVGNRQYSPCRMRSPTLLLK